MRRVGPDLKNAVLRHLAVAGFVAGFVASLALLTGSSAVFAQSGTPAPDQKPPTASSADVNRDNQRKTDEFVEATQAINGPAGNPECVWLGRRVVRLMWLDDLDTAFRHLDLYDRFGCPGRIPLAGPQRQPRRAGEVVAAGQEPPAKRPNSP
jgi:hypothetical protein